MLYIYPQIMETGQLAFGWGRAWQCMAMHGSVCVCVCVCVAAPEEVVVMGKITRC